MKEIVNTIKIIENIKKESMVANPAREFGLPIFLAVMLSVLLGVISVSLGILAAFGRKQKIRIRDIISFRSKMTFGKYEQ